MTPEYQELLQEFHSLREQAAQAFKGQALQFLRENQEGSGVVAMRWVQYAPRFNDGDTCSFEVQSTAQFCGEGESFFDNPFEPWGNSDLEKESEALLHAAHPEVLYQLFGTDVMVIVSLVEGEEPFHTKHFNDY